MKHKQIYSEIGEVFECFNIVVNDINTILIYDSNDKIIFKSISGKKIFNLEMDIDNGIII